MVKRRQVIKELSRRGYQAKAHTSIKNGVQFNGIQFIEKSGVCPVIYTDTIIENAESLQEAVEAVLKMYNGAKTMVFDKDKLLDSDFIMKNVYIGLQKTSIEDIIRVQTDFEGIEKYLYVRTNEEKTNKEILFKLTPVLLEKSGLAEDDAWKAAEKNTFAETKITPITEMLSKMTGVEIEDIEGAPPQYIVSNAINYRGASAILNKGALEKLARELDTDRFIVLPSSIHEIIVVPDDGSADIDLLNSMVQDVNESQVAPEERLADRIYIIDDIGRENIPDDFEMDD